MVSDKKHFSGRNKRSHEKNQRKNRNFALSQIAEIFYPPSPPLNTNLGQREFYEKERRKVALQVTLGENNTN